MQGTGRSRKQDSEKSDYLWQRQQKVREWHANLCIDTTSKSPISGLWISVLPDGNIRTLSVGVEPVQVPALLLAIDGLRSQLQSFIDDSTAQVVTLRQRSK